MEMDPQFSSFVNLFRLKIGCVCLAIILMGKSLSFSQEMTVDWRKMDDLGERYLRHGARATGDSLYGCLLVLPHKLAGYFPGSDAFFDLIEDSLRVLRRRARERDTTAIKLLFVLEKFADGSLSENIYVLLGNLVEIDARLFLQMLSRHYETVGEVGLRYTLTPSSHDDNPRAWRKAIQTRMAILKRVHSVELRGIRDKCLETLISLKRE
jgi:hypothetical protein